MEIQDQLLPFAFEVWGRGRKPHLDSHTQTAAEHDHRGGGGHKEHERAVYFAWLGCAPGAIYFLGELISPDCTSKHAPESAGMLGRTESDHGREGSAEHNHHHRYHAGNVATQAHYSSLSPLIRTAPTSQRLPNNQENVDTRLQER